MEAVASETLDGRLGNEGILVGIFAIAFLNVDMPRVGVPFCLEAETGEPEDGSWAVLWVESSVPDLGDVERTMELVATEATERENEEGAYGPGAVGDK